LRISEALGCARRLIDGPADSTVWLDRTSDDGVRYVGKLGEKSVECWSDTTYTAAFVVHPRQPVRVCGYSYYVTDLTGPDEETRRDLLAGKLDPRRVWKIPVPFERGEIACTAWSSLDEPRQPAEPGLPPTLAETD
jgi:hypothetical protein